MYRFQTRSWIVLALLLLRIGYPCRAVGEIVTPVSGVKVARTTTLKPGLYHLSDLGNGVMQVSGQNFTLDCKGAKLIGSGLGKGIGLHIADAKNVTIKNADVTGWQWGIVIERSIGVTLMDCKASRNADLPPGTVIDESGQGPEDTHGGGIVIRDSRECRVLRCIAQHEWDGIDVVRSTECVIEDGDTSYDGNWGLHLWDSSRNTFRHNRAVWCTTGSGTLFQALTGWQTYDAQAVGIDHNSNENLIEGNDLRFGGDGIFIRANEGPIAPGTVVPPRNGSHRNRLIDNDCSFSPNNAIEVDLVDDTVIKGNNCSYSHYGMWLGYSRRCIVTDNICIDDTAHAVEIENGQDDTFANNVFGYDTPRPGGQLVYLRQNGRDSTPSGPYTFTNNVFYGAERGVLLKATTARMQDNVIRWTGKATVRMVTGDAASKFADAGTNAVRDEGPAKHHLVQTPVTLAPGAVVHLRGIPLRSKVAPVVEIDGVPVWVQTVVDGVITFRMPDDFWDRPAKSRVNVRVLGAEGWADYGTMIQWPADRPRIENITPNPARVGDSVTISGVHLQKPVLFNNKPADVLEASPTRMTVRLPESILTSGGYNVLVGAPVGSDGGDGTKSVWPVTFRVEVPAEQMPHLLSAVIEPKTLRVGDLLTVTFKVRNNLPTPVALMTQPVPPFTYDEKQSWEEVGVHEVEGTLNLRVTSDHPEGHDPGSWPWLFGFDRARLAPGETATVIGRIRVQTPGIHEFRVGLVATGGRFIDDNAFRTRIEVTPVK